MYILCIIGIFLLADDWSTFFLCAVFFTIGWFMFGGSD